MKVVVLTGAGISAESGVPVFRGDDGLWEGHRVEDVATPEGFAREPALVQEFYNGRRRKLATVQPNPAHRALASLEAKLEGSLLLVTQNIDDLHERAGSRSVCHMHGELLKGRCVPCGGVSPWVGDMSGVSECPRCQQRGGMRPHVVWFGEMPFHLDEIGAALAQAELFVSIGTSGRVYPAAGFVERAREGGARTLELNLEESSASEVFDESRRGRAGDLVPAWVDELLR